MEKDKRNEIIEKAKEHFKQGSERYIAKDYAISITHYAQSCELFTQSLGNDAKETILSHFYYGKALLDYVNSTQDEDANANLNNAEAALQIAVEGFERLGEQQDHLVDSYHSLGEISMIRKNWNVAIKHYGILLHILAKCIS